MGSIWLTHLPDMLADAGVRVATYKGWEKRARSSGGYDDVRAIALHHTASSASPANDMAYMWENASDGPIGAIYLDRTGLFTVGAAGATNTMGKGGPLSTSGGTIPLDKGNLYMVAIESANNGVGETWPGAQIDAYIKGVHGLCESLGLAHSDVFSHAGYCQPSCPGRKIDPRGPTPSHPNLGGSSGQVTWPDPAFRRYLDALDDAPPTPVTPPVPPGTDWVAVGASYTTPPGSPVMKRYGTFDNTMWLQAVLCSMPKLSSDGGGSIYNPAWVGADSKSGKQNGQLYYADATHNALAYWQGVNGLTADGVYGSSTASKMAKVRGK
jgi:hypothetical protein